jgi:hypothetical protein
MELLTRVLPYDLGAKTSIEFRDNGLRFQLDLPGEHIWNEAEANQARS